MTNKLTVEQVEQCNRCGCSYAVWYAPSPLWNAVMRGGSINGPWEFNEMICPTCFTILGEERGVASYWRVDAKEVHVELEYATPSGRVWDEASDMWIEPHRQQAEARADGLERALVQARGNLVRALAGAFEMSEEAAAKMPSVKDIDAALTAPRSARP